ncbi:MAG: L-threonylcarbamoyladenylate synthase [Burkholderiaceae bacterium]|nr:threonylcarbamoyl-AMP synthase [Burkholderiales bacterium]MCZ8099250.1 L-threonylcarbamoyladenylate synthase [Burkholderiales bacterium]MCZ8337829.1 L-threonylcarbamoyladenylate synthase [Burkholderiaceae bacterium]
MIEPPTDAAIDRAARALLAGGLVALPTETVYGLGADAAQRDAVARIYAVKGRPAGHPLIVHVPDAATGRRWARFDARAERLVAAFWPGPLTLILPRLDDAPAWACGGQGSVGLRCPSHPIAHALLARFVALGGLGVAAPSANRFGRVSPTRAAHVVEDLGEDVPLVLDGGPSEVGVESTIVDLSRGRPVLLRPGRIGRDALEAALGEPVGDRDADAPRASGTLAAHYQPHTPVDLVARDALEARIDALAGARVAVWSVARPARPVAAWIEAPDDAAAYEAALYDSLRRLDALRADRILVEAPPAGADRDAARDRLARAAHRGG